MLLCLFLHHFLLKNCFNPDLSTSFLLQSFRWFTVRLICSFFRYAETSIAIAYEQQGYFEQAQGAYELAMTKFRNDHANGGCATALQQEVKLWESGWVRSSKELNQWEILLDYGNAKGPGASPQLVLESSWRGPNWHLMKESLQQVNFSSTNHEVISQIDIKVLNFNLMR